MRNPISYLNTIGSIVRSHTGYGILILLLFAGLITFCGCNKKPAQDITFAVGGAPAELDFWQELLAGFEMQTGIKVDMLRQPTDTDLRRQGLVTSLRSSRTNPDVFLMDVCLAGAICSLRLARAARFLCQK